MDRVCWVVTIAWHEWWYNLLSLWCFNHWISYALYQEISIKLETHQCEREGDVGRDVVGRDNRVTVHTPARRPTRRPKQHNKAGATSSATRFLKDFNTTYYVSHLTERWGHAGLPLSACLSPANTRSWPKLVQCETQQTRSVEPVLVWCWASVADGAPALDQHWSTTFLLGVLTSVFAPKRNKFRLKHRLYCPQELFNNINY